MKSKWIVALGGALAMSLTLSACYEDGARPGRHRPHDRHDGHDRHDRHDRHDDDHRDQDGWRNH